MGGQLTGDADVRLVFYATGRLAAGLAIEHRQRAVAG